MRKRVLWILVLVFAVGGVAGGTWHLSAPEVSVGNPTRGPAVEAVYATGVVEPVTWAKVTPLVRGRIIELCACEGETIEAGGFLARLDAGAQRARIAELEARAAFLARDAERYRELVERRTVSAQAYERAATKLEEVRAVIAAERERLADYTLTAPIGGVVLRRDGEVGEVVAPGEVVFWVGRPRPLWIVALVDEEDIPKVRERQRTLIKADAFPGRAFEGTVRQITPKGDPVNKNYRVRIDVPADTPLLIGMTTEVNIVVGEVADVMLVPVEAVVEDHVFVVANGRAASRPVTIGIRGTQRIEVTGGLALSDTIVLDPPSGLGDGARIRTRTGPASP